MSFAILLPDGVAVRNFVLSSFLHELAEDAVLIHEFPETAVDWLRPRHNGQVQWQLAPTTAERPWKFAFRQVIAYGHMYAADTRAMRFNRARSIRGSWQTKVASRTARRIGQAAAAFGALNLVENVSFHFLRRTEQAAACKKILREIQAKVLFCANQRAPQIVPFVLAARDLGIPTVTFIVSWDNLTSKGRIAAPFDHYLVWGPKMREELLQLYPSISEDQVHIVGSPQFDPYGDPSVLMDKREFFAKIGADPERPLICFSGGEPLTTPEDQDHLRVLMELISDGRVRGNPQVLVRPSPADDGERYRKVLQQYPELIYSPPRWRELRSENDGKTLFAPGSEDIWLLANLTKHVDVNINTASTMTLDFAFRDKPVVNPAFDVNTPLRTPAPLREFYYRWEHYAPVVELGAAKIACAVDEFANQINLSLEQPSADREGRQRLVDLQVGAPAGESAGRVARLLREIAR